MQTIYITVQMTHDALTHIWYICDSWHNQDWLNKCRVEWPTADVHLAASVCLSVWEAVLANVGLLCQESRRAVRNLWKPLECYPWCCSSSGYTALYSSCGSFWSTWPFLINFCITFLNLHVGCACLSLDVFGLMCFFFLFFFLWMPAKWLYSQAQSTSFVQSETWMEKDWTETKQKLVFPTDWIVTTDHFQRDLWHWNVFILTKNLSTNILNQDSDHAKHTTWYYTQPHRDNQAINSTYCSTNIFFICFSFVFYDTNVRNALY